MIQIQVLQVDGHTSNGLVVGLGRGNRMGPRYIHMRYETICKDWVANPKDWLWWGIMVWVDGLDPGKNLVRIWKGDEDSDMDEGWEPLWESWSWEGPGGDGHFVKDPNKNLGEDLDEDPDNIVNGHREDNLYLCTWWIACKIGRNMTNILKNMVSPFLDPHIGLDLQDLVVTTHYNWRPGDHESWSWVIAGAQGSYV